MGPPGLSVATSGEGQSLGVVSLSPAPAEAPGPLIVLPAGSREDRVPQGGLCGACGPAWRTQAQAPPRQALAALSDGRAGTWCPSGMVSAGCCG